MTEQTKSKWDFAYTTRDIVILAVVGAIAGVVNTFMGNVWYAANTAWGPLGGALLQGAFMWAYLLAFYLVRKPGSMLIIGILETVVEVLLGNQAGIATLGWGLTQGIAAEAVMAFTYYRGINPKAFALAGAAASQFGTVWTFYLYGWEGVIGQYWLSSIVNLISGAVLSGLVGYHLGVLVGRTGLVRAAKQ